jgi:hypothetical protein
MAITAPVSQLAAPPYFVGTTINGMVFRSVDDLPLGQPNRSPHYSDEEGFLTRRLYCRGKAE